MADPLMPKTHLSPAVLWLAGAMACVWALAIWFITR